MNPTLANVGIGILIVQLPAVFTLLILVVIIESLVARRWLGGSFLDAANGLFWANAASTIVGYPLGWIFWSTVHAIVPPGHYKIERPFLDAAITGLHPVLQLSWLSILPSQERGEAAWGLLITAAILLIPSFYISVWIERRIFVWIWAPSSSAISLVGKAVRRANVTSYLFLFAILICYAVYISVGGVAK